MECSVIELAIGAAGWRSTPGKSKGEKGEWHIVPCLLHEADEATPNVDLELASSANRAF
jgi:hypothetical protein